MDKNINEIDLTKILNSFKSSMLTFFGIILKIVCKKRFISVTIFIWFLCLVFLQLTMSYKVNKINRTIWSIKSEIEVESLKQQQMKSRYNNLLSTENLQNIKSLYFADYDYVSIDKVVAIDNSKDIDTK